LEQTGSMEFYLPFRLFSLSLWLIRNDFIFNDVIIASPYVSVFRTLSFMQKWKILNKERNQTWIVDVMHKLKAQIASLRTEG
jgi:hypothetical protein